jgi:hypothetical protein
MGESSGINKNIIGSRHEHAGQEVEVVAVLIPVVTKNLTEEATLERKLEGREAAECMHF